jgi:hypothetical protein
MQAVLFLRLAASAARNRRNEEGGGVAPLLGAIRLGQEPTPRYETQPVTGSVV